MFKDLFFLVLCAAVFMGQVSALGNQRLQNPHKPLAQNQHKEFDKSQKPYPNHFVILSSRELSGMFSLFDDVFDLIKRYELGQYKGIGVNFDDRGVYYEPNLGKNWWSYYFEPISFGKKKNIKKIMYPGNPRYIIYVDDHDLYKKEHVNRKELFRLLQKYLRVKSHIQAKIDKFQQENLKDCFVISVHYRGTDKIEVAPSVPYQKVLEEVVKAIKLYADQEYKIFVATDEQAFLDYMINLFGDLVCYNKDALRSTNGKPVHLDKKLSRYKSGEDAIIDCILLSKGNILIRTSSNLSRWSTYFNPHIPVVKLNDQYNGR